MLYLSICIALILIAQVSAFSAFPTVARKQVSSLNMLFGKPLGGKPKAPSASSSKPGSISVKSATSAAKKSTEKGKDMTWGGRYSSTPPTAFQNTKYLCAIDRTRLQSYLLMRAPTFLPLHGDLARRNRYILDFCD